jgi:hypothetical protein
MKILELRVSPGALLYERRALSSPSLRTAIDKSESYVKSREEMSSSHTRVQN